MSGYPIAVFVIIVGGAAWLLTWLVITGITRIFGHPRVPKATARRRRA